MSASTKRELTFLELKGRDPYEYYERLRQGPDEGIRWDESMSAWLVSKYADCKRVHTDEAEFAHEFMEFPGAVEVQGSPRSIILLDGADHAALRRFFVRFFSVARVEEYRSLYIRPLIDGLIAKFHDRGEADLDRELADPLPAFVIAALLGVPLKDEETLRNCKDWTEATLLWAATFGEDSSVLETGKAAAAKLNAILLPIIRDRRDHPQDDLISALWREGPNLLPDWAEDDVLAGARICFNAGSHTTSHLIRNCYYLMLTEPDLRERLRNDISLVPAFVEETLRYLGVIHFHIRTATTDTEIEGCPIHAGDRIHPVLAAANRDPDHFSAPLVFRLDRENARSHLGFGFGERLCVGAHLARMEVIDAVTAVLERFDELELDESKEAPALTSHFARSYAPLHGTWRPRAS